MFSRLHFQVCNFSAWSFFGIVKESVCWFYLPVAFVPPMAHTKKANKYWPSVARGGAGPVGEIVKRESQVHALPYSVHGI